MRTKNFCLLISIFLLISVSFGASEETQSGSSKDSSLRIHLPRKVKAQGDIIRLGDISIIRGEDSLVAKANQIALGKLSVPSRELVIGRTLILGRLACNGINASKVTFTGAEEVKIIQQRKIIEGSKFVEIADSYLAENLPGDSICRWIAVKTPKDLVLPVWHSDAEFSPHLVKSNSTTQAKVKIIILSAGKQIAVREVSFRLGHRCRETVTLREIPAGQVICPENAKVKEKISSHPEPAGWSPPYGLIAKRNIAENTVILPNMIAQVKPKVVVKRNKHVAVVFERPGLSVTAVGKAMEDGRVGDYIKVKVQITDTPKTIFARVNENGTVEPVL